MSVTLVQNFKKDWCCVFCNTDSNDTIFYGPVYECKGIIAHYFCLLLASNLHQNGADSEGILGFLLEDIGKEVARARKLSCSYCRKKGASIGCAVKSCRTMYHLPCGISKQALSLFYDRYPSYCCKHRSWVCFPNSENVEVENLSCLICLENLSQPLGTITWSTCCKNAWYHKRCIQEVALNSGYYFRCPNCNDDKSFRKQMLEFGIYIPNQDASWEREPNAYSGFYERYNHCDAAMCHCPGGREASRREGSWQIILCYRCLQKGIHKRCGSGVISRNLWSCSSPECLNVNPPVTVTLSETSSEIATQSSTRSNRSENKENLLPRFNSGSLSNQNSLRRRVSSGVLNGALITECRRGSLSLTLRSHREHFSDRQTRNSCPFTFDLPSANSEHRHSCRQIRNRCNSYSIQKTKNFNRPRSAENCSTSTRCYNTRSHPVRKCFVSREKKRMKRRKYLIDRRVVAVYPSIMKSIKDFEISL